MIAWGPDFGIDPQVVEPVVSVADIAPTLAEIAGVGELGEIDGRSLALTLTTGAELAGPYAAFAESHTPRYEHGWSGLRAIVIGDEKLIDAPRKEFYDLAADSDESNDIAAQRPEDVQAAQELLDALVQEGAAIAPLDSSDATVDEEQLAILRSLGYASTGRRVDESLPLVDPEGIDPKDKIGVIRLYDYALVLRDSQKPAEAIPHFAKLVEKDPTNPGFFFQYAQAQIMVRDLAGAKASLKSALELDPEFSLAWYRAGQIHDALGEFEAAELTYRRAFDVDPLAVDPRKALASLIADQGRVDEAVEVLEEARELAPNDAEIARTLGKLRAARP
jgi:tetratricopeptide (TPR) repeat protein